MHRRDRSTGGWIEVDDLTQAANVNDLESDDEIAAAVRDARSEIVKLEADLRRLAPAAMTDPKVRQECADIQSRLRAAHDVIELDSLAREETARREAAALVTAAEKRWAAAEKLLSRRLETMKQFDRAALELARAITACESLSVEADLKLQEAGAQPGSGMLGAGCYERALRFAFADAGVSGRAIAFEGAATGHLGPLAPEPAKS